MGNSSVIMYLYKSAVFTINCTRLKTEVCSKFLIGETGETSDTGDFGHYTQPRGEALNHEPIAIYMYTNTKYDACKRLRMLGELA